jgi:hypothetical protein
MKKNFIKPLILATAVAAMLVSCNRRDNDLTPDDTTEQTTTSSDEANVTSYVEDLVKDVNDVVSGSSSSGARVEGASICGATIDSTSAKGNIILNFDGSTTCNGRRTRSGTVTVSLTKGSKWTEAGAQLTVVLANYKVTRVSDNKSVTLNGTKTITNVNGGLIKSIASGETIVHKIKGNMAVTFDDGSVRAWQIARKRTFSNNSSVYKVTLEGDTSIAGIGNVDVWGTNRFSNPFYGVISSPIVRTSTCDYDAVSGVKVHKGLAREITITFGVDSNGDVVTSTCPYGYKAAWTNRKGASRTAVIQYR